MHFNYTSDNSIFETIIKFILETLIRMFSNGQITTYGSSFDELLCTKDSDWRFQDEWRIISNPGSSVKLRAKAVYLGFDVSHENEEQMKQCSLKNNFILYKMDNPIGVKKIVYSKIN